MTTQENYNDRMKQKGFVKKQLWVHIDDVPTIAELAELLREKRKLKDLQEKLDNSI